MYHGAGGAGHGGLLVADGKRPVTDNEEKFYKWNIGYTVQLNNKLSANNNQTII